MADKGIVITGLGLVTGLGLDCATSWERLVAGHNPVRRFSLFDPKELGCFFGVELPKEADGLFSASIKPRSRSQMTRATMIAVVGLSHAETQRLCASGKYPSVCHTNTNNDTCGVFSGKKDEIGKFFEDAMDLGALSTVLFNVTIPYHHPQYLTEASHEFLKAIIGLSWRDAGIPVISSIDQKPLVKSGELVDFIAKSLASPVHWHHVVQAIAAMGAAILYECGPGISLSQNGRFIQNGLRYITIKKALKRTGA
jgi:malonyl CoA-acyl carrier protein transacylase